MVERIRKETKKQNKFVQDLLTEDFLNLKFLRIIDLRSKKTSQSIKTPSLNKEIRTVER